MKEISKIQEKFDSQLRKNRKIGNNSENYKETPIFLTELKSSIIALEQEKTRLESQLLNFRSSPRDFSYEEEKQQNPNVSFTKSSKAPQVYPNLFSDDYESPEMNLKQFQSVIDSKKSKPIDSLNSSMANKSLQPGKPGHTRAKSAPKNVNPNNFQQEYGSLQNPDELIEELNYLANNSNPRLNESDSDRNRSYQNKSNSNEYNGKTLQQNFEDNLSYQRINVDNNFSDKYLEDDKNSSGNNSYENSKNIFDLNQIPLNYPNSQTLARQNPLAKSNNSLLAGTKPNNRSLSNEQKKQINVSIQSLMQEASGNNTQMMNQNNITGGNLNQGNLILIKRCKFSSLHQDCNRHKKYFKFNLDSCSLKEIQFFESVCYFS